MSQPTKENPTRFEKATIYVANEFMGNIVKREVRFGEVAVGSYAQYAEALHVKYTPKGARKARGFAKTPCGGKKPYLLIVEGHGHVDPPELFGRKISETVSQGTHRAFSSNWEIDWVRTWIEYRSNNPGVKVIFASVDDEIIEKA